MLRVGIPRALDYYRYYPLVRGFADALGIELVVSPPTSRSIMADGLAHVVAETCLPLKAYCGHLMSLRGQVDFVFVPSVRSVEPGLYNCVKLLALPDVARGTIPDPPPVVDFSFDISAGRSTVQRQLEALRKKLGVKPAAMRRAIELGLERYWGYQQLLKEGLTGPEAIEVMEGVCSINSIVGDRSIQSPLREPGPDSLRLAVLGHPYMLYDSYNNHGLLERLRSMGAHLLTTEMLSASQLREGASRIIGDPYWACEHEITGAAGHYLHSADADGVVVVTAFGCGPDSMMVNAVQRVARRRGAHPLLVITVDEHTAEAGLVTRLEAFVDTVQRGKRIRPRSNGQKARPMLEGAIREPLKVAFPRWGHIWVPLSVGLNHLKVDYVVPPPCSQRSLDLASQYSPEFCCIPYKLTLGNYMEALEMGANTLLQLSGPNNCRFGYYSKLQMQTLTELGYEYQMLLPQISGRTLKGVLKMLQQLAPSASWMDCVSAFMLSLSVLGDVDRLERKVQYLRARELKPGSADAIWQAALVEIGKLSDRSSTREACARASKLLDEVPIDSSRDPLRIAIVGEIYVVQEPFINHDIERELGRLGVEVHRSEQLSDWLVLSHKLVLHMLGLGHTAKIRRAEQPYLQHWSGETVGQSVLAAEEGYDGVIHLAPFTCTPEIVAQNLLPRLRRDVDIPVLTLILDEQMGRAGVITRLEAFIDFLHRRRLRSNGRRQASSGHRARF